MDARRIDAGRMGSVGRLAERMKPQGQQEYDFGYRSAAVCVRRLSVSKTVEMRKRRETILQPNRVLQSKLFVRFGSIVRLPLQGAVLLH
jgi:hypothetical protein